MEGGRERGRERWMGKSTGEGIDEEINGGRDT